jgi:hypothetical protein
MRYVTRDFSHVTYKHYLGKVMKIATKLFSTFRPSILAASRHYPIRWSSSTSSHDNLLIVPGAANTPALPTPPLHQQHATPQLTASTPHPTPEPTIGTPEQAMTMFFAYPERGDKGFTSYLELYKRQLSAAHSDDTAFGAKWQQDGKTMAHIAEKHENPRVALLTLKELKDLGVTHQTPTDTILKMLDLSAPDIADQVSLLPHFNMELDSLAPKVKQEAQEQHYSGILNVYKIFPDIKDTFWFIPIIHTMLENVARKGDVGMLKTIHNTGIFLGPQRNKYDYGYAFSLESFFPNTATLDVLEKASHLGLKFSEAQYQSALYSHLPKETAKLTKLLAQCNRMHIPFDATALAMHYLDDSAAPATIEILDVLEREKAQFGNETLVQTAICGTCSSAIIQYLQKNGANIEAVGNTILANCLKNKPRSIPHTLERFQALNLRPDTKILTAISGMIKEYELYKGPMVNIIPQTFAALESIGGPICQDPLQLAKMSNAIKDITITREKDTIRIGFHSAAIDTKDPENIQLIKRINELPTAYNFNKETRWAIQMDHNLAVRAERNYYLTIALKGLSPSRDTYGYMRGYNSNTAYALILHHAKVLQQTLQAQKGTGVDR